MMTLQEFIGEIIPAIKVRFPDFLINRSEAADESLALEWVSPHGKLILRLCLVEGNLTLGFAADKKNKLGWHLHMDQFDAVTPSEQAYAAIWLIGDIFFGRRSIVYSSRFGFFLTEDVECVYEYRSEDEVVKLFFWSDL